MIGRLEGESERNYRALKVYVALGSRRTLAAVAERTGLTASAVRNLSSRFNWGERVSRFEDQLEKAEAMAVQETLKDAASVWVARQNEHREKEWELREAVLDLAKLAIERWKCDEERAPTLESIAKMLELASKLGRLATGLGTERAEITGLNGSPVRVELSAALHKIYSKPLPVERVIDVQ